MECTNSKQFPVLLIFIISVFSPLCRGQSAGCPAECTPKFVELERKITDLEARVNAMNKDGDLPTRVSIVESYINKNLTEATDKLQVDLADTSTTLSQSIADTRTYIDSRIESLSSASENPSSPVIKSINDRLDQLEFKKVQVLIDENLVWRRNFAAVNRTFSKMHKSSYSNAVVVSGYSSPEPQSQFHTESVSCAKAKSHVKRIL